MATQLLFGLLGPEVDDPDEGKSPPVSHYYYAKSTALLTNGHTM